MKATIITSQPILATSVKAIIGKYLIDSKKISIDIDKKCPHTIIKTPMGNLVMVEDPKLLFRVFSDEKLRPKAVVLSTSGPVVLEKATAKLLNNEYFIDPAFDNKEQESNDSLTNRQAEILQMFADGVKTEDVAKTLGVSTETIRTHTKRILAKLNAKTRTHAVAIATSEGLIHTPKR